ncbi:hypothetical protein CEXT_595711 [Caerostris extrusa]|uniref:Uncharacterized protein n=1 Tax=Caerostris extrusa TaxID=172846 RepID=A0AAV4XZQ6_CAEEX|nr:hypothetical protein CEXT_595711 [Caerostris extrusa]
MPSSTRASERCARHARHILSPSRNGGGMEARLQALSLPRISREPSPVIKCWRESLKWPAALICISISLQVDPRKANQRAPHK